jgi:hypothetical protein
MAKNRDKNATQTLSSNTVGREDIQLQQLETPVALIIFNRPDTTQRVYERIRQARPRQLLILADGPRPDRLDDVEQCAMARAIVEDIDWDCRVYKNFSDVNLGLRDRYVSGMNWVFDAVDEVIVLEDDCLPHPTFFPYCAELLARYRHEPRIMWITGNNLQMGKTYGSDSYFFSRYNQIWGYALWKRTWQLFDINVSQFPIFERSKKIENIIPYKHAQEGFLALFELAYKGELDGWDAQMTFSIWNNDGLAITPNVNLISNIGFDQRAVHTTRVDDPLANQKLEALDCVTHPPEVQAYTEADIHVYDNYVSKYARPLAQARRRRQLSEKIPFYKPLRFLYRRLKTG